MKAKEIRLYHMAIPYIIRVDYKQEISSYIFRYKRKK